MVVFSVANFLTYGPLIRDHPLLPGRERLREHLRGLIAELPPSVGLRMAGALGIDIGQQAPPAGQFKYYEKVVSFPLWALLVGLVVITGLLKAMRYVYPVPGPVLWLASFIHVAAMVLLAAKLLDHLRYVLAPSRWPMLVSMVSTWMSADHARREYPEWAREREAGSPTGDVT